MLGHWCTHTSDTKVLAGQHPEVAGRPVQGRTADEHNEPGVSGEKGSDRRQNLIVIDTDTGSYFNA